MGHTRIIFSDATTAEAASALKSCGYLESSQGGLFTNPNSPIKIYVVWGKSPYFPELAGGLDFAPRIQIHLKCRDIIPELFEVTLGAVNGLRGNSPGTRSVVFNADTGEELPC